MDSPVPRQPKSIGIRASEFPAGARTTLGSQLTNLS